VLVNGTAARRSRRCNFRQDDAAVAATLATNLVNLLPFAQRYARITRILDLTRYKLCSVRLKSIILTVIT